MKKVLIISLIPLFINSGNITPLEVKFERVIEQPIQIAPKPINQLVDALIYVESRGNDSIIGDKHLPGNEAVGALQIRPIMVREVNRILEIQGKTERFTLKDRFDRQQSIRMFMIWKNYHHKDSSPEKVARNWNGGPKGYKKDRTIKYWNKKEKQLNK